MELKQGNEAEDVSEKLGLNRTFMELKQVVRSADPTVLCSLNRTFMELKLVYWSFVLMVASVS